MALGVPPVGVNRTFRRTADYLFLMVPKSLRQNPTMRPRNEFLSVVNRLSVFFEPQNYTGVKGLYVFGY